METRRVHGEGRAGMWVACGFAAVVGLFTLAGATDQLGCLAYGQCGSATVALTLVQHLSLIHI